MPLFVLALMGGTTTLRSAGLEVDLVLHWSCTTTRTTQGVESISRNSVHGLRKSIPLVLHGGEETQEQFLDRSVATTGRTR